MFDPILHRYYDLKRKRYCPRSVSQIANKSSFLSHSRFDSARLRGTEFHAAIDQYWHTGIKPINVGKYQDWVDSFLNYRNLFKWRAVCSEFRLIDRTHDIAGTLDLILKNIDTGRVV